MCFNIYSRILISERMYHWVGTGEEYNPMEYHMFPSATIVAEWGRASCVVVKQNRYDDENEWRTQACEQPAAYVCELPLGKSVY